MFLFFKPRKVDIDTQYLLFAILLLSVVHGSRAFQRTSYLPWNYAASSRSKSLRLVTVDLVEMANNAASGVDLLHTQELSNAAHHQGSITLEGILSTMYATTADGLLAPAHGHSNPLFGPPDPLLEKMKSIAPSGRALLDMGVQTTIPNQESYPEVVKDAISNGWKIKDLSDSTVGANSNLLPGFRQTQGILPQHVIRADSPQSFVQQVQWSVKLLNVIDRIPIIAFLYALVEFFLLRPGVDWYKEEIEEDGTEAFLETVSVTGVRVAAFSIISIITLAIFG